MIKHIEKLPINTHYATNACLPELNLSMFYDMLDMSNLDWAYKQPNKRFLNTDMDHLSIFTFILNYEIARFYPITIQMYENYSGRYIEDTVIALEDVLGKHGTINDRIFVYIINSLNTTFKKQEFTNKMRELGFRRDIQVCEMLKTESNGLITGIWERGHYLVIERTSNEQEIDENDYLKRQMLISIMIYKQALKFKRANPELEKLMEAITLNLNYKENIKTAILDYIRTKQDYTFDVMRYVNIISSNLTRVIVQDLKSKKDSKEYDVRNYFDALQEAQRQLDEINMKYAAIKYKLENDTFISDKIKMMLETVNNSKSITKFYIRNNYKLYYDIECPLYVNDEDEWTHIEDNIFTNEKRHLKKLLHETFIDKKYKLYSRSKICYNFETQQITPIQHDSYLKTDMLPQPHLAYYQCFGTYKTLLAEAITNLNYDMIIELTIEAASGLNWSDAVVVNNMIRRLWEDADWKTFERQDGTRFSVNEYIEEELTNEANTLTDTNPTD